MNDREQFEAWWKTHCTGDYDELLECWQVCAESKQAELDNLKFEFERSVREHEECKRYADSLRIGLDKANAEVEHYLSAYEIAHKQAMANGEAYNKANARINELTRRLAEQQAVFDRIAKVIGGNGIYAAEKTELNTLLTKEREKCAEWVDNLGGERAAYVAAGIRSLT